MRLTLSHLACFWMIAILPSILGGQAWANEARPNPGFNAWLSGVRAEALASGLRSDLLGPAIQKIKFIPRIIELDQKQPEKTRSFNAYKKDILSGKRIGEGRRLYRTHYKLLKEIEREYGVPAPLIVALWGIETHYGKMTGGYHVLDALATLAYEGRRGPYFRKELMAALKILNDGHISPAAMKGSWAGAMGQNQFMPTSFERFAQDHDRDGKRNIWTSLPDIFASSANYLNQSGWVEGQRWGRAVKLSPTFNTRLIGLETTRSVKEWSALGVTLPSGRELPLSDMSAWVVRPQDSGSEAYLVYPSYRAIMEWNRSTYFATTVGLLADQIASAPAD